MQKISLSIMLQARMGSTRLPGKVLLDFNGVPLIEHIYNQLLHLNKYDLHFVLSTSPDPLDDQLADWAARKNIQVVRHDVDDIVGRLSKSLQVHQDQFLVRVWGDCVFICPDIVDDMIQAAIQNNYSYVSNAGDGRNLPVGLDAEIYSADLLNQMDQLSDSFLREYPLQYVLRHPEVKSFFYRHTNEMPVLNLTVDYPEDLTASRTMAAALTQTKPVFLYADLLNLYQKQPHYFNQFSKSERQKEFKDKLADWQSKGS